MLLSLSIVVVVMLCLLFSLHYASHDVNDNILDLFLSSCYELLARKVSENTKVGMMLLSKDYCLGSSKYVPFPT